MPELINEVGNRYGKLVVVSRAKRKAGQWPGARWNCLCACGATLVVLGCQLRGGSPKQCSACRSGPRIDISGRVFGSLTAIEPVKNKWGNKCWTCRCVCGAVVTRYEQNLLNPNTKKHSCGGKKCKLPPGEAALNSIIAKYKNNARRRGRVWGLSREQVRHLTKQPCHYCGKPPSIVETAGKMNGSYVYNGLDRVDNDCGYTIDNVVACCTFCNRAKWAWSVEEFRAWLARACAHMAKA